MTEWDESKTTEHHRAYSGSRSERNRPYDADTRRRRTNTTGCPSCPSRMAPSRSREKKRPCGPSRPAAYANKPSSSSSRTTSFGSSLPPMNGGSTLQLKSMEKDSNTRGDCGSPTISTHGILPNCASTHKTLLSRQEDRASREALSPASIPQSFAELLRRLKGGGGRTPGGDSGEGTGITMTSRRLSSQPRSKGKRPHVSSGLRSGEGGSGPSTGDAPEPRGGAEAKERRVASKRA